jgi:hypothetical protein
MNRLQPWQFRFAGAVTFSVFYSAWALAVTLFPDGTIGFFNAWFPGLDLTLLRPPSGRPLTPGQFVYCLVSAAVVSFVVAALLTGLYNVFARASRS